MDTLRQHSLFDESRFQVLRILHLSRTGVSLREIAYRARLAIRTIQTATQSLVNCGQVTSWSDKQRKIFKINEQHPDAFLIAGVVELITRREIMAQSSRDARSNIHLLGSISQMNAFAHHLLGDSGH